MGKKKDKGLIQQANMMSMILNRMNDSDYYIKEAQRERDMKDSSIPFVLDKINNVYHLKGCVDLADVPEKNLVACRNLTLKAGICSKCFRRAVILQGMNDEKGAIYAYREFFNTHKVSSACIKRLTVGNQGKYQILNAKSIMVTIRNEDTFFIEYSEKDKAFLIYHNNYVNSGEERHILPSYHLEDGGYDTLEQALDKVSAYSWEKFHKYRH